MLRFPQAPTLDSHYGNAIHATLEWVQHVVSATGAIPVIAKVTDYFAAKLATYKLPEQSYAILRDRGENALAVYVSARGHIFKTTDKAEHNFGREGVFVDGVHMAGKVDRIEIDHKNKTITVVDYKTGKSYSKWTSDAKLHKYQLQLYCYKLLIEGSHSFKGYTVTEGRLEFIEPDNDNKVHSLSVSFNDAELQRVRQLLAAMWRHVYALDFPDTSTYDASVAGMKQFEADLIQD